MVIPLAPTTKEGLQAGIIAREGARDKKNLGDSQNMLTPAWMRGSIPPSEQTEHGRCATTALRTSRYDNLVQGSKTTAVPFVTVPLLRLYYDAASAMPDYYI